MPGVSLDVEGESDTLKFKNGVLSAGGFKLRADTVENITYYQDGVSYSYGFPEIEESDEITVYLYSTTPEFATYYNDVLFSFGSNPMMGTPYNVSTNIQPYGKAVGFFEALSVVSASIIY